MIVPGMLKRNEIGPRLNMAWMVLFINVGIFLLTNLFSIGLHDNTDYLEPQQKNFNFSLGLMYLQTLDPIEKAQIENLASSKLAAMAVRDQRFWSRIEAFPFSGDAVVIDSTRQLFAKLKSGYEKSAQYQYGLGSQQSSPWVWITYQFTHFSLMHLLSNLVFLFLVISYLEKIVSGAWIALVYVLGGLGGGIGFLLFSREGDLAMIGASGSVCALLCFLVVVKSSQNIPWVYFIAPVPRGYGEIHMPAWLIFPIYLIADFSSLLWEPQGLGTSVAHSAHVGGTLTGLLVGFCFLIYRFFRSKASTHSILGDHDGLNELF